MKKIIADGQRHPVNSFSMSFSSFSSLVEVASSTLDKKGASTRVLLKGSLIDLCDFVREHVKPILFIR